MSESDRALVERLRELERNASAGPWLVEGSIIWPPRPRPKIRRAEKILTLTASDKRENDAELVGELLNALPRLLGLAERGLDERADVVAWLRENDVDVRGDVGQRDRPAADDAASGAHVGAAARLDAEKEQP